VVVTAEAETPASVSEASTNSAGRNEKAVAFDWSTNAILPSGSETSDIPGPGWTLNVKVVAAKILWRTSPSLSPSGSAV
jgi:hypothetical protein